MLVRASRWFFDESRKIGVSGRAIYCSYDGFYGVSRASSFTILFIYFIYEEVEVGKVRIEGL